jgi:acyl-CoA thioesterase FadM
MAASGAGPLHRSRFHVIAADTDAAGTIYFAAPLPRAERVLTDWRRRAWMSLTAMLAAGIATPVVRTEVSYFSSLVLDAEVEATLWPVVRSERSFNVLVRFAAVVSGRTAVEVGIKQAIIQRDGAEIRPATIPPGLAAAFDAVPPLPAERLVVTSSA